MAREQTLEERRDELRLMLEDLYGRSMKDNDLATAVEVLDRLCLLDGLYAPKRVGLTNASPWRDDDVPFAPLGEA